MTSVLVVEQHADMAESIVRDLRRKRFETNTVHNGTDAMRLHENADLVLLDLQLSDVDGLEVCRSIRAVSEVPIIAFTSLDTELDRVLALQAGADDCMVKTCGPREVLARIDAVMRRSYPEPSAPRAISLRPLHIDGQAREVRLDDRPINVTAKEFELLYTLASRPDAVVSRRELMATVWESNWAESSRTIDTHVSSLRFKLGAPTWIVTVRGVGYRIGRG